MDGSEIVVLIIANTPLYLVLGKLFFGTWANFGRVIRFWFTPELFSAFRGEYWDDVLAEFKLAIFIGCCSAVVIGEYHLIMKYLL